MCVVNIPYLWSCAEITYSLYHLIVIYITREIKPSFYYPPSVPVEKI
jgi:hypothetical protein